LVLQLLSFLSWSFSVKKKHSSFIMKDESKCRQTGYVINGFSFFFHAHCYVFAMQPQQEQQQEAYLRRIGVVSSHLTVRIHGLPSLIIRDQPSLLFTVNLWLLLLPSTTMTL
jgi:hypothetical protein